MNVLSKLTKEYLGFEEGERDEDKIYGVERHSFKDISGKLHERGYYIPSGDKEILRKLIDKLIERRGDECDLNDIDVSNIENMQCLFSRLDNFNCDISKWNVSRVNNMSYMFFGAKSFNQPINNWNVSRVVSMSTMFSCAYSFNQPLDKWDVSNVLDMSDMFSNAKSFNQSLDKWDVASTTYTLNMFNRCPCKKPKWYIH